MNFENTPPQWDAKGSEPTTELKTKGFMAGYKPPAAYFNWLFNRLTACVKELQTKLSGTDTTTQELSKTRRLKTYISFSDIGLSVGSETIADIVTKLPDSSALFVTIGADCANIYPVTYGTLHVQKRDSTRTFFEFLEKTNNHRFMGVYDSTQTEPWSDWLRVTTKDELDAHLSNKTNPHNVTKAQVGLGNADNTSDANKPVSTAQAAAIADAKAAGTSAQTNLTTHLNNKSNPHGVTKAQVGLGNVPNVSTNDQTPTYSDTTTLATLTSGEKLNIAFQKIKCAITNLITHINTHKITTLTSLGDVGQTFGEETIEGIANGMPENSELFVSITSTNAAIYPLQYGILHVYKNNTSRVFFRFYSKSTAGMWIGVYDSTATEVWTDWTMVLTKNEVIDNLLSTSDKNPLSANQGRKLDERLVALEEAFPAGCDTIVAGCTAYGVTPASNSPADIVEAIGEIYEDGKVNGMVGTAVAADVLAPKTFTNSAGIGITGTMTDKTGTAAVSATASLDATNSRLKMAIPATGKYGTNNYLYAAYSTIRNLIGLTAAKIVKGNTILGLAGTTLSFNVVAPTIYVCDSGETCITFPVANLSSLSIKIDTVYPDGNTYDGLDYVQIYNGKYNKTTSPSYGTKIAGNFYGQKTLGLTSYLSKCTSGYLTIFCKATAASAACVVVSDISAT